MFNTFMNDLGEGIESTARFPVIQSWEGVAGTLKGCAAIHGDLGRLESWSGRNLMSILTRARIETFIWEGITTYISTG